MANCNALSKKARKLTKTELESVLSYADFLISKHKNARHEAHYIIDAKELSRRIADLDAGRGEVHALL